MDIILQAYREIRDTYRQFIPAEIRRRVSLIARNLRRPISTVLGDLIVKALSKDPSELTKYRLSFCEKLSEGWEPLEKENLVQASEKFWNAVVQAIKAVDAQEDLELKTHADLWNYINILTRRYRDIDLAKLFAETNYLHKISMRATYYQN